MKVNKALVNFRILKGCFLNSSTFLENIEVKQIDTSRLSIIAILFMVTVQEHVGNKKYC